MSTTAPDPQIEVTRPTRREVYGQEVRPQKIFRAVDEAAGPEAGAARREKVAVLVCHGMGQQVPFEHIDLIAAAIRKGAGVEDTVKTRVKFVTLGDQRLPRAEIDLDTAGVEREVHVYEAYWAPLTEGKVSALDVTRFLFDAGFRGIEYALRGSFDRLMMGGWHSFRLGGGTLAALLAAFTIVCSALLLYGALGLVAGLRAGEFLFGGAISPDWIDTLAARLLGDLLRSPLLLSLLLLPALAAVWVARVLRGRLPYRVAGAALLAAAAVWAAWANRAALSAHGLVLGGALLGVVVLGGAGALAWRRPRARTLVSAGGAAVVGLWTVHAAATVSTDLLRALFPAVRGLDALKEHLVLATDWALRLLPGGAGAALGGSFAFQLLFLSSAVLACLRIRSLYIQFLGDVAVYLSSHTLNEFDELRTQIRKIGRDVGCAIYRARDEGGTRHEYGGVVVVGHSLGSVVAYDTLNAVLNLEMTVADDLAPGDLGLQAEDRTLRLITFGSPLDKSAFIFRTQTEKSDVREGLAAAVQPLIECRGGKRRIRWTNLFSRMDPISGPLEFYDPPLPAGETPADPPPPERVHNRADPEAGTFGQAHTTYWTNRLLADELFAAVREPLKVPSAARP